MSNLLDKNTENNNQKVKMKQSRLLKVNGQQVMAICNNCGKGFPVKRDNKGKYCTLKCWLSSDEHKAHYRKQFKGKKLSPEHIEKMAASKRGKKQAPELVERRLAWRRGFKDSPETIEKRSKSLRGKKRQGVARQHILDGNAKSFGYKDYNEFKQYPDKNYRLKIEIDQKKLALERDQFRCLNCESTKDLQVDHIVDKRRIKNPIKKHELTNLITLCRTCHLGKKGYKIHSYEDKQIFFRRILSTKYGYTYPLV